MVYMGSKNRLAKHILPIILKDRKPGQVYVEPFCGGCNIIDKVPGLRIANDLNPYLIAMLRALINGWTPPDSVTEEEYKTIKSNKEHFAPELVGYIGIIASFRGKFFNWFADKILTKTGKVRDYQQEQKRNLERQIPSLIDVTFSSLSYTDMEIPNNSIIYCDPPYKGTTGYLTNEFCHEEFWNWCRLKTNEGHTVFISEYEAPQDFTCVFEHQLKSSLCGKNKVSTEKLFTYSM